MGQNSFFFFFFFYLKKKLNNILSNLVFDPQVDFSINNFDFAFSDLVSPIYQVWIDIQEF